MHLLFYFIHAFFHPAVCVCVCEQSALHHTNIRACMTTCISWLAPMSDQIITRSVCVAVGYSYASVIEIPHQNTTILVQPLPPSLGVRAEVFSVSVSNASWSQTSDRVLLRCIRSSGDMSSLSAVMNDYLSSALEHFHGGV